MIKLRRYLKPHIFALVLAIALLFVQAFSDLKLPNYMAQIVNVGIQQNGIEHASPDAISQKGYTLMSLLMSSDEKQEFAASYTLVNANDAELVKKYSLNATEPIYILNTVTAETRSDLDTSIGKATWTLIYFARQANPNSASDSLISSTDLDMDQLYQVLPVLQTLPYSALDSARQQSGSQDASTLKQTGVVVAKALYSELGVNVERMQMNYVVRSGLEMVGVTLIGTLAVIIVTFLASRIASKISWALRHDIFKKVMGFSNDEFDTYSSASLITRTTNDITQIQQVLTFGIRLIFYAPIMGIGGILMIQNDNASMTWIIVVAVAALIAIVVAIMVIALPKFKATQRLVDRVNQVARESLTGIMVIRAFGNQTFESLRFGKANRDLADVTLFVTIVMAVMMPLMMLVMNLTTLLIVWVGAHEVANATMQIGSMMAFIQYTMQIIAAFLMIAMIFIMIPRAQVSAVRISEVLETKDSIVDPSAPEHEEANHRGEVVFDHVSFKYQNAADYVLHDISFKAMPGTTTAIIGSTGSGKSTLINLVPRFYDVSEGAVLVGGVDVRKQAQTELREMIGYVPQKGILLSGTIRSNLVYGKPDADDAQLEAGARIAQATDFINRYDERFDAPIAQGGGNVSGGQKQRLSIARALIKDAPILIFDDSFSALDFKTDRSLREALADEMKDKTLLIVAQRVNTIMNAEQIVVLDEGQVVGIGTHEELLHICPTYYEIASSQLSKEELGL